MFKSLFKFLKKLLKWLLPILAIALIIAAVFFPTVLPVIGSYLSTAWGAVSGWVGSAFSSVGSWIGGALSSIGSYLSAASFGEVIKLATGAAIILNPDELGEGLGSVAEGFGEGVGSVLSSIPTIAWIAGGFLLWMWLSGDGGSAVNVVVPGTTNDRNRSDDGGAIGESQYEWSRS